MAEKKPIIVIKKVIVSGGGHHGGSWKVALADFMTALMAFFLVMWLVGQSEETKKAVSDYFSTPSVIEYNYQNFGAEITLEKLFLDVLNEPLKAFQSFMEPAEKTPNLVDMGSSKVVAAYIADQLTDAAKNVSVSQDGYEFDIPDYLLFQKGGANPTAEFVKILDKVKAVTSGLKDANIKVTSSLFVQSIPSASPIVANKVSNERLDLVKNKIAAGLESASVSVVGQSNVKEKQGEIDANKLIGFIKISVTQKEITSDGKKPRKLDTIFGTSNVDMSEYNSFVNDMSNRKQKAPSESSELKKQVDHDLQLNFGDVIAPSKQTE